MTSAETTIAIELEKVSAGYHSNETVLKDINISIPCSCFATILGPNGSGKSTLLRVINGWLKNKDGKIKIFGKDLKTLNNRERSLAIGMVPQHIELPLPLTVKEIVTIGRTRALSLSLIHI